MTGTSTPSLDVSVVLPVLNEVRDLGVLLDQLEGQREPQGGFEIVVSDGGSTDGTRELLEDRARNSERLRWVDNRNRRSSPGRNVGVRVARGRYILFLDGHCRLEDPTYLQRVTALFDSTQADCLCRPQSLLQFPAAGWARAVARARHSPLGHKRGSEIYGGKPGPVDPRSSGAAYRAAVWEQLGGYDERFDACEDVEFNHRVRAAGLTAFYDPSLAVAYRPRESARALWRQMLRYGRGRAHLAVRHPGTLPLSLVGSSLVVALTVVLLLWGGAARLVAAGGTGVWLLLCVLGGLRGAQSLADALRTSVCLGIVHVGLTAGFLRGLLDAPRFRGRGSVHGAA